MSLAGLGGGELCDVGEKGIRNVKKSLPIIPEKV